MLVYSTFSSSTVFPPNSTNASHNPQRLPLPFIPGGSLIPVSPPISLLLPIPALCGPRRFPPTFVISSTLPFCKLKAGHTQTPQLHLMPCHAYRPICAPHLMFGHSSRPVKRPCSRAGRIQDSGWRKWCVQAGDDGSTEIGSVRGEVRDFAGAGVCTTR
jgi:hypothetical protein